MCVEAASYPKLRRRRHIRFGKRAGSAHHFRKTVGVQHRNNCYCYFGGNSDQILFQIIHELIRDERGVPRVSSMDTTDKKDFCFARTIVVRSNIALFHRHPDDRGGRSGLSFSWRLDYRRRGSSHFLSLERIWIVGSVLGPKVYTDNSDKNDRKYANGFFHPPSISQSSKRADEPRAFEEPAVYRFFVGSEIVRPADRVAVRTVGAVSGKLALFIHIVQAEVPVARLRRAGRIADKLSRRELNEFSGWRGTAVSDFRGCREQFCRERGNKLVGVVKLKLVSAAILHAEE